MLEKFIQKVGDLLFKFESEHTISNVFRKAPDTVEVSPKSSDPVESLQTIELFNDVWEMESVRKLHNVDGHLIIKQNSKLRDLSFLENLESVKGSLLIIMNNNLRNLKGLRNLVRVDGDLCIIGNLMLTDLSDLRVQHVGGDLKVFGNPIISYGCTTSLSPGGQTLVVADTKTQIIVQEESHR